MLRGEVAIIVVVGNAGRILCQISIVCDQYQKNLPKIPIYFLCNFKGKIELFLTIFLNVPKRKLRYEM